MDDNSRERAAAARAGSPFLTTKQAAFYLGISVATLEKMRSTGRYRSKFSGPVFRRHGGTVVYHVDDLECWSEADR